MRGAAIWDPSRPLALRSSTGFRRTRRGVPLCRPETSGLRLVNTSVLVPGGRKGEPAGCLPLPRHGSRVCLRQAGKTGWDLYWIALAGGQYGEAERLSDSINSPFDEREPTCPRMASGTSRATGRWPGT